MRGEHSSGKLLVRAPGVDAPEELHEKNILRGPRQKTDLIFSSAESQVFVFKKIKKGAVGLCPFRVEG
jgi:hypothetical protein